MDRILCGKKICNDRMQQATTLCEKATYNNLDDTRSSMVEEDGLEDMC